jgi:prepilin-type N-terminal cleavage/methylation domain-containing protein/prepilin-type processing-associated H-X9-DG protein
MSRSSETQVQHFTAGGGCRAGFTLVELLVVIGIIAVLISILLPTLNRARESARSVKCLSNMRQLSEAVFMFAQDHKGYMPGRAGSSVLIWDSGTNTTKQATSAQAAAGDCFDWIAWQRKKDPVTGQSDTGAADQNITFSGLARYLGSPTMYHTSADQANQVGLKLQDVYRCPSDNLEDRPKNSADNNGGRGAYRYSYALNDCVAMSKSGPQNQGWPAPNPPSGGVSADQRSWGHYSGKISSIKNPSDIIMFVCEDELTIDDGVFVPRPYNWGDKTIEAVATRHDLKIKKATGNVFGTSNPNENGYGNVSFCDGHAGRMSRVDALRQKHSGNPYPDPVTPPFN